MRTGKRAPVDTVPILHGKRIVKLRQQAVDRWNNRIVLCHGELATGI
jgi:hypothetical protein